MSFAQECGGVAFLEEGLLFHLKYMLVNRWLSNSFQWFQDLLGGWEKKVGCSKIHRALSKVVQQLFLCDIGEFLMSHHFWEQLASFS